MSATKVKILNNSESESMHKRGSNAASTPIRIGHKTKSRLEQLLRQANKGRLGRKVKADDLMCFGLGLINDDHISEICNGTLSNKDRMELLFQRFSKERRGATREDFLGLLLEGKVTL